ncbi:MAG TPA: alpha/beta hydrolase, partial [Bryobacteraceae bacterium]|nr:alpha/beta hydrolase [Bryobacteraceae bacterium]
RVHLLIIPFGIIALGICYQLLGRFLDARRYGPPGRLISVGGQRMHIVSAGEGRPTVVFESGIAASSINWDRVRREIAGFARVCVYDRAGYAWSDRPRTPRTPETLVSELRELLHAAREEPPYILVGHSFGGLITQLYARMHPDEVASLVLVDPALLVEWSDPSADRQALLARGVRLARRGAWLGRIGFVRLALTLASAGARRVPRTMAAVSGGRGASAIDRIIGELRKLPPELLPVIRAHWSRAEPFIAMAEHFAMLPAMCSALARRTQPAAIPVAVISGAHLSADQCAEHEAIARASAAGRHIIAERGGHWVHLDAPEIVVAAVRDMFHSYRGVCGCAPESTFRERSQREGPETAVSRTAAADARLRPGNEAEGGSWRGVL